VSVATDSLAVDRFGVRRALAATGLLRTFNDAAVLAAADVHVAERLAELAGEPSDEVRLALALAVRAPRQGHVFVDLATIRDTATVETEEEPVEISSLPWPEARRWLTAVAGSQLVAVGEDDPATDQPLRLLGTRLYLDRYWREERAVASELNELSRTGRLTVIAGGPGTGKTTRAARLVAQLIDEAPAGRPPLIALAAPTGKAAARLQEAVHEETARMAIDEQTRALLMGLRASTLHRLLRRRPDSRSRFVYNRGNRLPHDVVIVDETSMVSLSLMARVAEAVRPDARLILVGDPAQLASIETGVVLGDIVGAALAAGAAPHPGIVVLERVHRYGGGIGRLAGAIRRGDAHETVAALRDGPDDVTWIAADAQEADLEPIRARAVAAARTVLDAARVGDAHAALAALRRFRLLCAHRRGAYGVSDWSGRVQAWLGNAVEDLELERRDYAGRPLLVTENDYELGLYNGDTGVIVQGEAGQPSAAFERGGELLRFSPLRLGEVETVYAMTIHKSQGSQFDAAAVLLPAPDSRILTRELLYTAVTRARRELILVGTEEAVRRAVEQPVARASGLRERLWGAG
jgi:exodeoxyribonuclease V alpha subunit